MPAMTAARHPRLASLDELDRFDELVDVRSPAEFADDHLPGAINAPVLDNDERARVGTLYAKESPFKATRIGAALVARRLATHLDTLFADRPAQWKPLVYCWRGGKRSGAVVEWFNLIGWRAKQLDGGYKRWRTHVMQGLASLPAQLDVVVLAGATGSGKTRLLHALAQAGAQTLDLEGLARHRGSLLGDLPGQPQPSQRGFETALFTALSSLDPARPVFVEAESRRIGALDLPTALMEKLHAGRCIRIEADPDERVAFLLEDYAHLFDAPPAFKQRLAQLVGIQSHDTVAAWQALVDADARAELFHALIERHYDPAYRRSSRKHFSRLDSAPVFRFHPAANNPLAQARDLLAQFGHPLPDTRS